MGLFDSIAEFYGSLEEKYRALCDSLQEKGISIYDFFVDPLESHGIPSFPVFILLILALFSGLFYLFSGTPVQADLIVIVESNGSKIDGAIVTLLQYDKTLFTNSTSNGSLTFIGIPKGKYTVGVSKEGYNPASKTVDLNSENLVMISLSCSSSDCGKKGRAPEIPVEPPVQPSIPPIETPQLTFHELDKGSLSIFAQDQQNRPVDAVVKVFNDKSGVELATVKLTGGHARLDDLDAGLRVYMTAQADGYLSFSDRTKTWVIEGGLNVATISLTAISGNSSNASSNPNYNVSWVTVKNSTAALLANVEVQFFINDGSGSPVVFGKYTDAIGMVSANLPRSVTVGFYATASKTGYFTNSSIVFQPGRNTSITLYPTTDSNGVNQQANLEVVVLDEFNMPVSNAIVAAYSQLFTIITPLGNKQTDFEGKAFFTGLAPMQTVVVNATKGTRIGRAVKTLVTGDNAVEVSLLLNTGFLNLTAYDAVSGDIIPAHFNASLPDLAFGQCDGASCVIEVRSGVDVYVTAYSEGYDTHTFSTRVAVDQVKKEFVWLVQDAVVKDSLVSFQGLFDSQGRKVTNAYPGRTYAAKFQLLTKNADLSGMHFAIDPSIAWINSVYPPAAVVKASETSGCTGLKDFAVGKKYAWMDLTFGGDRNLEISFNITIKPDVPLDWVTHSANLTLSYRSFIKRGDAWIRNPLDYVLLAKEDSPLSSGCNAASYSEIISVASPQMTCNNFGCVTMEFTQAGKVGPHQNFTALSLLNINPQSASYAPVVVNYRIDLYKPLAETTFARFSQTTGSLLATQASIPYKEKTGDGLICENGGRIIELNDYSFALDASFLVNCLSYAADLISIYSPFSFSGEFLLKPLSSSDSDRLTLEFSSGEQSVSHSTTVNVVDPNYAETDSANLSLTVSQPQSPSSDQDDPYEAFISLPPLNISFGVGIKKFALSHYITLTSSDGSSLNITSASVFVKRGSQAPVASSITLDGLGRGIIAFKGTTLEPGDFVYGVASAIPQKEGSSALVLLDNATLSGPPAISFLTRNIKVLAAHAPTSGLSFESISQLQNGELKTASYPATQNQIFQAFTLESCQDDCDGYGNLFIEFALPVSVDVPNAQLKLVLVGPNNFVFQSSQVQITHADSSQIQLPFSAGGTQLFEAKEGDVIRGTIELKPLAVGDAQLMLSFEGGLAPASGLATFSIDRRPAQPPDAPEKHIIDWISAGDCQRSEVTSDASQLNIACGNLTMRVSPVFPADGIQVVVSSSSQTALTVKAIAENPLGISNCFESCDSQLNNCAQGFNAFTMPGNRILRFNPLENANCPLEPYGNVAPGGSITLKIWRATEETNQSGRDINIKILGSETPSSLYVAPLTPKHDYNRQYIHDVVLWALVNNRQLGDRLVYVNNKLFSFNGPGVQTFVLPKGVTPVLTENNKPVTGAVWQRRTFEQAKNELALFSDRADKTAYWRGNENQTWWCDETKGECRPSLEDWQIVSYYFETTQTQCKFCNNSQGAPCSTELENTYYPTCAVAPQGQFVNCDSRCEPIDPNVLDTEDPFDNMLFNNYFNNNWAGAALVDYNGKYGGKDCSTTMKSKNKASQTEFDSCKALGLCLTSDDKNYPLCFTDSNANGFVDEGEGNSVVAKKRTVNIGGQDVVEYYCENTAQVFAVDGEAQCAFKCAAANNSYSAGWCGRQSCDLQCPAIGYYEQQGALQTQLDGWYNVSQLIQRDSSLTPIEFAPFYYFRDYRNMQERPAVEFHSPANTQGFVNAIYDLQTKLGLTAAVNQFLGCDGGEAFYDFKAHNPGTMWFVDAVVLELDKNKAYLNSTAYCKKPDSSWAVVKLCQPVYTDKSDAYGVCFNSLWQNFPQTKGSEFKRTLFAPVLSDKTGVFMVTDEGYVAQATSLQGPSVCQASLQWYSPNATGPTALTFKWSKGKKPLGIFRGKSCARTGSKCKVLPDSGINLPGFEKIYVCHGWGPPTWSAGTGWVILKAAHWIP
ncbi:MAG: hypothetical protein V1811_00635 [Candidatus Micrarchaeota archaeon]